MYELPYTTPHAKFQGVMSTWVVWTNSQFDAWKFLFLFSSSPGPPVTSLDTSARTIRYHTPFWPRKMATVSTPSSVNQLQMSMSACIDEVASWMSSNRLQLNAHKTEMLWFASARRQSQLSTSTFRVCTDYATPSTAVRDLGNHNDSVWRQYAVSDSQVSRTVSHCFGILRLLRTIRRSLSQSVFQSLNCRGFGSDKAWLWKRYTRPAFCRFNWTACTWSWMQRLDLSFRQVSRIVF